VNDFVAHAGDLFPCHEGNYGMRNMLNAAREAEKATDSVAK
jgi:hypothetical protein